MAKTQDTTESGDEKPSSTSRRRSKNSEEQSSTSKQHWPMPRNVRQFAAQANAIATMLLNDQIDVMVAKTYAGIARVVTQAASIEVARSRFLKEEPDLSLDECQPEDRPCDPKTKEPL